MIVDAYIPRCPLIGPSNFFLFPGSFVNKGDIAVDNLPSGRMDRATRKPAAAGRLTSPMPIASNTRLFAAGRRRFLRLGELPRCRAEASAGALHTPSMPRPASKQEF